MHKFFFALTLCSPLLALTANAAEEISLRPGLWEVTTSSDLLWLVPQIPPDQMQNIKDLAKDYGFDMPQIENGAAVSNVCITQEMANQKNPPIFYQNQFGCTTKNSTHVGNNYKMDFVCTSAELNGNGTAEGAITSPENFSGKTKFIGTAQGNPVNEQADSNGKWINASCGTVKPLQ
ncbi:MAG TPA: DUF3617 domain-containing protein [Methylotenera sp.]|nr:DUF3617 domain-containing protein [Methylotenera sp.]